MSRKASALFTVAAFVLFTASCTTWSTKEIYSEVDYPRQDKKVLSVVKESGERVEFSKAEPGRVWGDAIVGPAAVTMKSVEVEGPFLMIKKGFDGSIEEITDAKGRVYYVRTVLKEEPNKLTIEARTLTTQAVSIPLSEARLVKLKKFNIILTALAITSAGAAAFVALAAYYINRD